jgi:hypothetical protein
MITEGLFKNIYRGKQGFTIDELNWYNKEIQKLIKNYDTNRKDPNR